MSKAKLPLFDKLMLMAAAILAVILAMGMLAGQTNPKDNIWITFAGLAYPFALVVNIAFIVFLVIQEAICICFSNLGHYSFGLENLNGHLSFFWRRRWQ